MENTKIRLFVTGGTIDKEYNSLTGELIFPQTHLPEMLKRGRCKIDIKLETVMLKDSLDMNDSDRKQILERCKTCKENKVVITHGTDTMVETAHLLGGGGIKDKTIVLLGAMVPYTINESDALFNLGCAIGAVQALPKGIYIAMNGKIFKWNNVRKNKKLGEFETNK